MNESHHAPGKQDSFNDHKIRTITMVRTMSSSLSTGVIMSTLSLLLLLICLCAPAVAFTLPSKSSLTGTSRTLVLPPLQVAASTNTRITDQEEITKDDTKSGSSPFKDFDYNSHWYPVIWAHDLRLNEPTQVTVFDVDYAIAKISETEVVGLLDVCPHKAAALSQGRMTASGNFQCAYHGWSFDGTSGDCLEIPQLVQAAAGDGDDKPSIQKLSQRTSATAVPTMMHEGMVWLFPGGNLEQALLAPPPPSVPEFASGKLKMTTVIRDLPVDWPILLSNICDPDHGVFSHQAKAFDWYTASVEEPVNLVQEFPDSGKGFVMKGRVLATDKVLQVDRKIRGTHDEYEKKQLKKQKKNKTPTPMATSLIQLPNHVQLKRVNPETNTTKFVTAFFICPVGVGRSRFMSASYSTMPPKRWLSKLFLDNFLDQDTYLLATQEPTLLAKEAKELKRILKEHPDDFDKQKLTVRRNLFALQSPSEKIGSKLEQFWDATLTRVPNRVENLLKLDNAGAFTQAKTREQVLDRASQHLNICPDAQDVVKNCHKLVKGANTISILAVATKLAAIWLAPEYSWASRIHTGLFLLKPKWVAVVVALSSAVSYLASKIIREYYYKYTDDYRRKDLSKIPTLWLDK
jgi:phenylpropionate dioxygenase-like ring-hydroxylating dioxygenase large terminal subunit